MANTTKGFPYPIDTDAADVPGDVQLLAEAVDTAPGITSLTQAQIDALSAAQKWAGRIVWNQTANKHQKSDGASFSDLQPTGGATGGGTDEVFYENDTTITASYSIPAGKNAATVGPISINSGVTITVPTGSVWAVI